MKRMGDEGRVALHGARLLMNTRDACCASALGGRRQAAPDEREVMHGERRAVRRRGRRETERDRRCARDGDRRTDNDAERTGEEASGGAGAYARH